MNTRRLVIILIIIIIMLLAWMLAINCPSIVSLLGRDECPDNLWIGGAIAIIAVIAFLAYLDPVITLFERILPGTKKDKTEIPYNIHSPNNIRNRANIIANVKESWIKGVYENNLQTTARIELALQDFPEALARPNLHLRLQATQSRAIPANTPIRRIFDESGQALLILGDPGSGKTFTMLELVNALLEDTKPENDKPLPVILNLSSWARERQSLEDWIVADLKQQYQLIEKVSRAWLEHDQLALMLDGLDEVDEAHQDKCVEAINTFKDIHVCPLVVCSRTKDYDELATRLKLTRAIEIQPLTKQQVDEFLSKPVLQLQAVRDAMKSDPDLRELATVPLILNVMALAYKGFKKENLSKAVLKQGRRKHLFNTYIRRMFQRRPLSKNNPFTLWQALGWLAYLARQLHQRSETKFFIESLQMDWLPEHTRRHYRVLNALVFGLGRGLGVGLSDLSISPVDAIVWRRPTRKIVRARLGFGLGVGLGSGLGLGLVGGLGLGLVGGPGFGLVLGLGFGLVLGLLSIIQDSLIPVESQQRNTPNQGIRQSIRNHIRYFIVYGLGGGLVVGLVVGLGGGLVGGLGLGLGGGLFFGLVGGLSVGLVFGLISPAGKAVVRHYTLRWLLHRGKYLPLKLVSFLDAMTARLLLRRVGGGYIFLHRMLLEHFASLSEDELDALAK